GADPVLDRSRHNVDGLSCFGLLPEHKQGLGLPSLSGRAEGAHFIHSRLVQVEIGGERLQVALLLANDLGGDVLNDARPVWTRLSLCSHKILQSLADTPDTRSPLSACSE